MANFKLVISTKDGKSYQREVKDPNARKFLGMNIGDSIKGEAIDLTGYEFLITGGSDYCGFPMRKDVTGMGRKKVLIIKGVGLRKTRKGMKYRKTVCGNTIHSKISQINLKVIKEGKEKLGKEEVKEEKPKEKKEVKEKPKKEEKPKEEKKGGKEISAKKEKN